MARPHKSFHIPGSKAHYPPDKEFHAEHITLRLKVDLDGKSIEGTCTTRLVPSRMGMDQLHFDACEMRVKGVEVDGSRTPFSHDGASVAVRLEKALPISPHEVKIDYTARPRRGLHFIAPDKENPDKPIQAWTQSEADLARYWYPCQDHPNDKSTSESFVSVPDGYLAISNGELLSHDVSHGWATFHWRESAPHSTYLNSIVVGKFGEIREESEGVSLYYFFPEEKRKDAIRYFGLTGDMIKKFNEITGIRYPYERYSQVAVHDFIYGGMENISATTLTDTRFPDERSEEDYAARYSRPDRNHIELVAHELAHMWFGDLVTAKHWPHAWLNEGFATYFEALYHEKKFGADELRQNMLAKAETYFEEDDTRYRRAIVDSTYVYPDDLFDAFTYEKGAWMIHQLRYLLGDDLFFKGTREYLRRYSYKNADTHDYMTVLEEVSGLSLEGYFDQFFFKGGHPEFEVEYSWDSKRRVAQVLVRQVQQVDQLTPIFRLPCEIVFYTAAGRQARRIDLRTQEERHSFELDSEPAIVEFDPEERLLKKVRFRKSFELLVNQLEGSIDCSSRARAAQELALYKSDEAVEALKKAAHREQYWSARSEAAKSLGKIGSKKALEALLELSDVNHRRVRRSVIAALAEFKTEERAHEVLRRAIAKDESPFVQCEAVLSLAKADAAGAMESILEAMKLPSPEHALTEAGLEALGYLKAPEIRAVLKENIRYGRPTRARIGALKGYIRRGWLDEEEVHLLKEVALGDKEYAVRDQLLETVAELGDRRFLDTMRRVADEDVDSRNRRRAMEVYNDLLVVSEATHTVGIREDVENLKRETVELRERLTSMKLT